jgi:hypothetical protein
MVSDHRFSRDILLLAVGDYLQLGAAAAHRRS